MKTRILSLLLLLCLSLQPLMAMNQIIDSHANQLQSKLSTYASLLAYRYKCLCVKTSPEALLPIEVQTAEGDLPLDEVAKVVIMDEEHFLIAPMSQEYLDPICQAFLKNYPQLKQKMIDLDVSDNIDPEIREEYESAKEMFKQQTGEVITSLKILQLTTPDINDDVKDQLDKSVDVLYNQAKVRFRKELEEQKVKLLKALSQKYPRDVEEGNRKLDQTHEQVWRIVEDYTQEIHSDIADENFKYNERLKQNMDKDTVVNRGDDQVIEAATIEADKVLYAPKDVFVEHLTFKRSFTQQVLSTFSVPFTFRSSDVPGKFYVFGSYDAEQNTVNLDPYTGLIEAGKGYFFLPDQDIEQLEFTDAMVIATPLPVVPDQEGLYGALSKLIFLQDAYLMQPAADGTPKLVKADAEATLAPYQSYLWLGVETEATELKINLTSTGSGIDTLDAESPQGIAPIFDLSGQRIASPKRSQVYIKQDKKYMNY